MTIYDSLKDTIKNFKRHTGEIGLEIETETKRRYEAPQFTYWTTHTDGSLRDHGVEYVLKQPVLFNKELDAALDEWHDKTKKIPFIKHSISTSVHVHLNILNESWKTLGNFLTAYTLTENILIRYSGPDRLSNLFCLPICDAEETYTNMRHMFSQIGMKNYKGIMFNENSVKYAACNLGSLYNYGSVEIRSFRGETDIKNIKTWCGVLYSLLEYARKDHSPKDIMLAWKTRKDKLLDDIFKDYRKEIAHPDEFKLIDKNVWYAASIAYAVKDWSVIDNKEKEEQFRPKEKELNNAAMNIFGRNYYDLDAAQQEYVNGYLQRTMTKKTKIITPAPARDAALNQALGQLARNAPRNRRNIREDANVAVEQQNPAAEVNLGQIRWDNIARQVRPDVFNEVEEDRE